MTSLTRRDALYALLSASIGGILPATPQDSSSATPSTTRIERHDFETVRDRIVKATARGTATGVAVAVAHNGKIVWEEGFGWANREAAVKATSRTPFNLASLTKPFTTTTLMTLVAEGKLSLDDPANNHLVKSKIVGTKGNADAATVRRLGAHVSGLPTLFAMYDRNEANLAASPDEFLAEYGNLAYPPGCCFEYSNVGFAALSAIASKLPGVGIGTLMTQRVLTPLGLDDSFFGTSAGRLRTGAARYDSSGNPIPDYITATPASGELYASAHDLARFAMFNMKRPDRARILDDRWIEELHKPVFVGPSGVATTFGWFAQHLKYGEQVIFKGGGQPGVAKPCMSGADQPDRWKRTMLQRVQRNTLQLFAPMAPARRDEWTVAVGIGNYTRVGRPFAGNTGKRWREDAGTAKDRLLRFGCVATRRQTCREDHRDAFRRGRVHRSVQWCDRIPGCKAQRSKDAESQTDSARRNAGGQDSRNRLQDGDAALRSQLEASARLKRDSSSFFSVFSKPAILPTDAAIRSG